MKNVVLDVKDEILTVVVDLNKTYGPSKSGKTVIIASTEGNLPIGGSNGATIRLNIYRPPYCTRG